MICKVNNSDFISNWNIIKNVNWYNRAILFKEKKKFTSLISNHFDQIRNKSKNITITKIEKCTTIKAENRRSLKLSKASATMRAVKKILNIWKRAETLNFNTQLSKIFIKFSLKLVFLQILIKMQEEMTNCY